MVIPAIFGPVLLIHCGRYDTIYNFLDKKVPGRSSKLPICMYINMKKKHFGHSFAFDAPTIRNNLSDDVHSAVILACYSKKLKSYIFKKAFPP